MTRIPRSLPARLRALAGGGLLAALAAAATAAHADPIVIRHDRDDAVYRRRAEGMSGLVSFHRRAGDAGPYGLGTLIAPRWVLSAAHVMDGYQPGHHVTVGSEVVEVDSVILYPGWWSAREDLALVRLRAPVTRTRPVPLYRRRDEAGKQIVLLGRGYFGTGRTGPTRKDGVLRAATNRVDYVSRAWISFRFDAPGTARAEELEGVSGPGDSGGPAFIDVGGTLHLAGVSAWQNPPDQGEGRYGAVENYARVSSYLDWIDGIVSAARRPARAT